MRESKFTRASRQHLTYEGLTLNLSITRGVDLAQVTLLPGSIAEGLKSSKKKDIHVARCRSPSM